MTKAQVTLEFLSYLLFYLVFLSLLLSSIHYHTVNLQKNLEDSSTLLTLEETARMMDSFYIFDSHFSIEMEGQYILKDNLVYRTDTQITAQTLYSEGELNGEAT